MQYLGQKFIYTKYVDPTAPTTKQIKVTDADGKKYSISQYIEPKYIDVPCLVRDLIMATSVAGSYKTEIAVVLDMKIPRGNTTETKTITIQNNSPMWAQI